VKRSYFPSKSFIVGEYAVVEGAPALLLAHSPFFVASFSPGASKRPSFHPDSPAGKYFAAKPAQGSISFTDPHGGKGGFGASGAEFLSVFAASKSAPAKEEERIALAWAAWDASREFPGSGADILTQAYGINDEGFFLAIDTKKRSLQRINAGGLNLTLSLFHTGKKLPTHEQKQPSGLPLTELAAISLETTAALSAKNAASFCSGIKAYGALLAKLGLLAPHSAQALAQLPPVAAAKACGAMGSDVLLVLHEKQDLAPWAKANSLAEILSLPV
jgi:hypothetical protein